MPSDQLESIVQSLAEKFATELRAGVMGALRDALFGRLTPAPAPSAPAASALPRPKRRKARKAKTQAKAPSAPAAAPAKKVSAKVARPAPASAHIETAAKIAATLAKHPDGLRSEDFQKTLDLSKADVTGALVAGLKAGLLRKQGKARGTKYRVGPKAPAASA